MNKVLLKPYFRRGRSGGVGWPAMISRFGDLIHLKKIPWTRTQKEQTVPRKYNYPVILCDSEDSWVLNRSSFTRRIHHRSPNITGLLPIFPWFPSSMGEGLGDPRLKMVKAIIDFLQHHVVMVPWSKLGRVEVKFPPQKPAKYLEDHPIYNK